MMASTGTGTQRRKWHFPGAGHPRILQAARYALCGLCGFSLSAASLLGSWQSLSLGLLCVCRKGAAAAVAAGGALGYLAFWGRGALQPVCCLVLGLMVALTLGSRPLYRQAMLLIPSLAALIVSACGVFFQLYQGDTTPVSVYFLRLLGAFGSACLFLRASERRSPVTGWLVGFLAVLALSGIRLFGVLELGYVAAGYIAVTGEFPAVILAGLGLDAAGITALPMTAVLCAGYVFRLFPRGAERTRYFGGFCAFLLFSALRGGREYLPAFWLLLGSGIGGFSPVLQAVPRRSGRSGGLQVQLETAAGVLERSGAVLARMKSPPPDEQAILEDAARMACTGCPCRKGCAVREQPLPVELLHRENVTSDAINCRKPVRMAAEVHRARQRYRQLLAQKQSQEGCRQALYQQYHFLSEYLQRLSDSFLEMPGRPVRYQPEVALCTAGKKEVSGDTGTWFGGSGNRYYLLLSDGMGTGLPAAAESRKAVRYLKELLQAGFPGEYAMKSLNSFCALQGNAGIVTADLLQLELDTGRAVLYKWGAAPSYLVRAGEARRLEGAATPLGLSVLGPIGGEISLQLRSGDCVVLVSDGAGADPVKNLPSGIWKEPAGEIAAGILSARPEDAGDDATALVLRLRSFLRPAHRSAGSQ